MTRCTPNRKVAGGWCVIITGLIGVILAVFLPPWIDAMIDSGIDDALVIKQSDMDDNTDTWKFWSDTSLPDSFAPDFVVYVWNITNPHEILDGAPANVTQMGPYYYTQQTKRFNVTFFEDEHKRKMVRAKEWTYWVFNRAKTPSHLSEDDTYTNLNGPFFQIISGFHGLNSIIYDLYPTHGGPNQTSYTDFTRMFTQKKVHEFMWGYWDPVLQEVEDQFGPDVMSANYSGTLGPNITSMDACGGKKWTYPFQCDYTTYFTGEHEPSMVSQFYKWNSMDVVIVAPDPLRGGEEPIWNGTEASTIYGTSGAGWHKYIDKDEPLVAYIPSLFRRVTLLNLNHVTYTVKGIKLWKFVIDPDVLVNDTANPYNAPYWQNVSGVLDISRGWGGYPAIMSKPHFLDADPSVQAMAVGMKPDRDLHDAYVGVEPTTGQVMDGHSRIQPNTKVWPLRVKTLKVDEVWFPNIMPGIIIPSCWVEFGGVITQKLADDFIDSVYAAQDASYYTFWVGSIAGVILIFLGGLIVTYYSVEKGRGESGIPGLKEPLNAEGYPSA